MSGHCQQKVVDAHFQSHASEWKHVYEEVSVEGAIYRERLAVVLSWIDELALPVAEQILEIGCGSGASAVALAQRGYLVQAMDSVEEMLNSTQESAARAGVSSSVLTSLGDAHSLAFPRDTYGLVLAIGVVPYLHSPEKALGEMARVLKPGGFLLLTAGNRWRLNHFLDPWISPPMQPVKRIVGAILPRRHGPRQDSARPPLRLGSLRELERWLKSAGFTMVKAKTVGFPPLTFRAKPIWGEQISIKLNSWLQQLADRNVPGIRSSGMDHIVLVRKTR
jgi:ubiquinone/menaquinone biosynthesis C-methylase UbiE